MSDQTPAPPMTAEALPMPPQLQAILDQLDALEWQVKAIRSSVLSLAAGMRAGMARAVNEAARSQRGTSAANGTTPPVFGQQIAAPAAPPEQSSTEALLERLDTAAPAAPSA